jgi:diadenosine tetraphosphatase ApaH/serine/threonine PP2A family protein phosphatase
MKIALITDLHANLEALQAVLDHADGQGVQQQVLLGDVVGYGGDPAAVVDRVRALVRGGAVAVQGNHDQAVAGSGTPRGPEAMQQMHAWTRSRLDAAQRDFLASLPLTAQLGELLCVHANADDPSAWGYITGRAEAVRSWQATRQRIVVCGHVHEPALYHLSTLGKAGHFVPVPGEPIPLLASRRWLVVPGACGQPRDGNPAAAYAVYDSAAGTLCCWRVPYDHATAARRVRAELPAGLAEPLARRLEDGR